MNNEIKDVFEGIYEKKTWGTAYMGGVEVDYFSGLGSILQEVLTTESYIKNFCKKFDKKLNISDLGCGDFEVGKNIRKYFNRYDAYDVVPDLIERNKILFKDLDVNFYFADICEDPIGISDVGLMRHVVQHLNNESVNILTENIQDKFDYLIVIQDVYSEEDGIIPPFNDGNIIIGKSRCLTHALHLDKPPFNLQCSQFTQKIDFMRKELLLEHEKLYYQYRIFQTYKLK